MEIDLHNQIALWLDGVFAGLRICGFNHDVWVEPTNGVWENGESFRITFSHEDGDSDIGFAVLDGIVSDFRRTFDAKVGETTIKTTDDGYSAVVEDVHGYRILG